MNRIDYTKIVDSNKYLISNLVDTILYNYNITIEELINSNIHTIKSYIQGLLNQVKNKNIILLKLEWDIKAHDELLTCYRNTLGIKAENYESFTKGGPQAKPDSRPTKIIQMQEDQQHRIETYDIKSKELNQKTKLIEDFICLLPQKQYSLILYATYFKAMTNSEISKETNYDVPYIDQARHIALQCLYKIIRCYLSSLK